MSGACWAFLVSMVTECYEPSGQRDYIFPLFSTDKDKLQLSP